MIRIGWFSPVSSKTGIATYTQQVLSEMRAQFSRDELDVTIYHPPVDTDRVKMPYPTITLSDSLLKSDFFELFDVAVYHVGNNSLNHEQIYNALMRHPGVVVLHDYVYQHYLAGKSLNKNHVGPSFVSLVQNAHENGFQILEASGVMRADKGKVAFVPWESEWVTQVPLSQCIARLGTSTIVHSEYARSGLVTKMPPDADIQTLFMPRPDVESIPFPKIEEGRRIHIACCGHIGVTKGLDTLLDAFISAPELQDRFRVTIAGFGSDPVYLESLRTNIQGAGLAGTFELMVDPSDEEFQGVMTACDIFMNLRYPNTEGASLSLMEQLAYGRPVIAYRTGSFAEFPDEACYFLNPSDGEQSLAELLGGIAKDPSAVRQKGVAARKAVHDKTATEYARRFVKYLQESQPRIRRRAALSRARAEGKLPVAGSDQEWLKMLILGRKEMRDFAAERLFYPDSFNAMPVETRGAFLAKNIMNTNVSSDVAKCIGREIENLPAAEMGALVGQLAMIAMPEIREELVKTYLQPIMVPVLNRSFWRIVSHLPAPRATTMSLNALVQKPDDEMLSALNQTMEQVGFKAAMFDLIFRSDAIPMSETSRAFLLELFEMTQEERAADLPSLPLGTDVLENLKAANKAHIVLDGFHDVESVGIWSHREQSDILLRVLDTQAATRAEGVVSMLVPAINKAETIKICIRELSGDREKRCELRYEPGMEPQMPWSLSLPGFQGVLKITYEIGATYAPSEYGLSTDSRSLGVLVSSLIMHDTFTDRPALQDPPEEDCEAPAEDAASKS